MDSARIEVHVRPGARRDEVEAPGGGALRVLVRAPAHDGEANEAVVALLAKRLGVARAGVRILRGRTGRRKLVEIQGVGLDEVLRRLGSGR